MDLYTLFDLSPPEVGHEGRALVFVDGFLRGNVDASSYAKWIESIRAAGWMGRIVGLHWSSGSVGGYINEIADSFSAFASDTKSNNLAGAFQRLGGILEYWKRATKNATEAGQAFGHALATSQLTWGQKEIRLAGFSLGARVIYEALISMRSTAGSVRSVDSAWFYGGALSRDADWTAALSATREGIVNYYSRTDAILRWLYRLAEFDHPVGVGPIPVDSNAGMSRDRTQGQLISHDVTAYAVNHLSYAGAVAKFQRMP